METSMLCSRRIRRNVEAASNLTKGLIDGQCLADERIAKPHCDVVGARLCWRQFRLLRNEATDFRDVCKWDYTTYVTRARCTQQLL